MSENLETVVIPPPLGPEKYLNCPFGRITLPIDRWDCKETRLPCPIQAMVDPPSFELFRKRCEMPRAFQESIEKTILAGRYKGDEHHMPGKRLCPLCDSKSITRRYHPLGELVMVSGLFSVKDLRVARAFRKANVERSLMYAAVCRPCLLRAWNRLKPALIREGVDVNPADRAIESLRTVGSV